MPTAAKAASRRPPTARADRPDEATQAALRAVSHELRTPLNAIIGFSEVLSRELYGPLGAEQYREYAGIIHDSGHKLLRLVEAMLAGAGLDPAEAAAPPVRKRAARAAG